MTTPTESALAIIDGALCLLNRRGTRAQRHAPLATAIVEFYRGAQRTYVREHPLGLLPGIPNLYCLDSALRLLWLAEWPLPDDPCAGFVSDDPAGLTTVSMKGVIVRLEAATGRCLSQGSALATAAT